MHYQTLMFLGRKKAGPQMVACLLSSGHIRTRVLARSARVPRVPPFPTEKTFPFLLLPTCTGFCGEMNSPIKKAPQGCFFYWWAHRDSGIGTLCPRSASPSFSHGKNFSFPASPYLHRVLRRDEFTNKKSTPRVLFLLVDTSGLEPKTSRV